MKRIKKKLAGAQSIQQFPRTIKLKDITVFLNHKIA